MQIELRDYQRQAVEKIMWSKRSGLEGNELIVLPTGAGKSIVIAHAAYMLAEPILILQPSKEILEQNYRKLRQYVDPDEIGIYSASMREKRVGFFTLGTIQSIYKNPEDFTKFKLVIVDEAHLINPKKLDGMYSKFFKAIGRPKVIGLTATPYRMQSIYIETNNSFQMRGSIKLINRMKPFFWNRILLNVNVAELIEKKYLCPLEYIDHSVVRHEELQRNAGSTDFDLLDFEEKLIGKEYEVAKAISYARASSRSILVFCPSVSFAEKMAAKVDRAAVVTGKTPTRERESTIEAFKRGDIQIIFNVGVLTTGFDHPALDCIILARPTRSVALYYQMLGRGLRIAEGKTSCKVIDLTSTVKNMGPVETIRLERKDKWELLSTVEGKERSWHGEPMFDYIIEKPGAKQRIWDQLTK